jgi:hypothetical protein
METDNKPTVQEEVVLKRQWIAVIAAFVLFFIGGYLSERIFGVTEYGILGVCLPMLYLGISSIRNRISIIRLRGKKDYSRDTRAVVLGTFMIVLSIAYLLMAFVF